MLLIELIVDVTRRMLRLIEPPEWPLRRSMSQREVPDSSN